MVARTCKPQSVSSVRGQSTWSCRALRCIQSQASSRVAKSRWRWRKNAVHRRRAHSSSYPRTCHPRADVGASNRQDTQPIWEPCPGRSHTCVRRPRGACAYRIRYAATDTVRRRIPDAGAIPAKTTWATSAASRSASWYESSPGSDAAGLVEFRVAYWRRRMVILSGRSFDFCCLSFLLSYII